MGGLAALQLTRILVDADGIAYRCASAVQETIDWGDGDVTVSTDLDGAISSMESALARIKDACGGGDLLLIWSCPTRRYFRHDLLPTYKGHRKGAAPECLQELREWASTWHPSKWRANLEADDVLGILGTNPRLIVGERIIASDDKDLLQIPGLHFTPRTPEEGVFRVSPEYAERQLWLQTLTGDAVDGYAGCPGIGPVKAGKILDQAASDGVPLRGAVKDVFLKRGLTEEEFLTQHYVARILQTSTYNFKKQEPIYG